MIRIFRCSCQERIPILNKLIDALPCQNNYRYVNHLTVQYPAKKGMYLVPITRFNRTIQLNDLCYKDPLKHFMELNVYRKLRQQPIALYIHMKHISSFSEVYGI